MSYTQPQQAPMTAGGTDGPGARLSFWDTGGSGEVVLLSHPASQSNAIWGHQQPALAAAGFRVVAYARRGFGASEIGDPADRGTETGDLLRVLDHLGIERVHLLGAAAGGGVAMRFTAAHPARVRSLILAGSIVSPEEAEWRELYARLDIAAVKPHVSVAFLELGPSYRAANPEGTAEFSRLSAEAHRNKPGGQPSGIKLTFDLMRRTAVPVLLLTGEADLYAPPPLQRLLARHLPRSELVTMREIGHAPYWEAPEDFNRIAVEFLRRARP